MERKIGEIFEYNGEWYQCIKGLNCLSCVFNGSGNCDKMLCSLDERTDSTSVFFKKLEKVGEPIIVIGRTFQKFTNSNSCVGCVFCNENNGCDKYCYMDEPCLDNEIWIEIKQIKEDMEETKLNIKPFSLEAAKAGKLVCTRDGRKARIICFDSNGGRPIVALVTECDYEEEIPYKYHCDGSYNCQSIPSDNDLMMLPEKKEGWVNIYRGQVYNTFEKAEEARKIAEHGGDNCLKTIKINWEE